MIEYIDLKIDFTNRNSRVGGVTLDRVTTRNYDTAIRFRIEVIGHTLDDTYDVKILSKFNKSGLNVMTTLGDSLEIVDGKIIYTPKVNLIIEADYIRNFLYLSKDGLGLDMAQFNYQVDVSQIGEVTLDIRQAYDEFYETLITEFEQALEEYKLTLPQADSVRAEIDGILTQFGVDSQAKLSQYDADAQQVIADNQTAFGLAESGRQDSYEQAESERNATSGQAIANFNLTADALLETVESNESARVDAEATRKTVETDRMSSEATRKSNETTRITNENARKSAEVIRLANEVDRVNAENVRAEFYEGFDGELDKKANKQQEAWITPTLLNGFTGNVRYRKTQFGHLEIYGTITSINPINNTATYNVFLLPLGYFPTRDVKFEAPENAFYSFKNARMVFSTYDKMIKIYAGQGGSGWDINVSIPIN